MEDKELIYALNAGYSYFHMESKDMQSSVMNVVDLLQNYKDPNTQEQVYFPKIWDYGESQDPASCLEMLSMQQNTVVIGKNFQWFLKDEYNQPEKEMITFFQNNVEMFSTEEERRAFIIIGDTPFGEAIPDAIQADFMPLDFGLPGTEEIKELYEYIVEPARENPKFKEPKGRAKQGILDSCRGMTAREIKNALAFSIVKDKGQLDARTVAAMRAKDIEKTAGIRELDCTGFSFKMLKGYGRAKEQFLDTYEDPDSLGFLLLGPAGTGKTTFAKACGNESGRPVYVIEFAETFGGLVGESEKLMRVMIKVLKKLAPCIVIIDEIEKGLAGSQSGAGNESSTRDGGTTTRSTAQFLKLLSDERPQGLFIIGTCNNVKGLDAAWLRIGRWDCAPLYVGLPNNDEIKMIMDYHKESWKVEGDIPIQKMKGWSGAEIEGACRMAKTKKVPLDHRKVLEFIIPISRIQEAEIAELENKYRRICVDASFPIEKELAQKASGKRKVKL